MPIKKIIYTFLLVYLGAEIFAKRRKRSEKWVVDASEPPQTPPCCGYANNTPTYPLKQVCIHILIF